MDQLFVEQGGVIFFMLQFLCLFFGILSIILFFKMWIMTDNVSDIKKTLLRIEKHLEKEDTKQ